MLLMVNLKDKPIHQIENPYAALVKLDPMQLSSLLYKDFWTKN